MTFSNRRHCFFSLLAAAPLFFGEAACTKDSSPEPQLVEHDDVVRSLPAGSIVREVELTRTVRTRAELADYVQGLAEAFTGTTIAWSEADAWAAAVLASDPFERVASRPFSAHPSLRVSYLAYFDDVHIVDTSVERPDAAELLALPSNSPIDMGIGMQAAKGIADQLLVSLENSGAIRSGPYAYRGTRGSRRVLVDRTEGKTYKAVSDFGVLFERTVDGVPILNSRIRVGVHRDGTLQELQVRDVESLATSRLHTIISDDDAFLEMETQAAGDTPAGMQLQETVLADKRTGYFLPPDVDFIEAVPLAKAKVVFKTGAHNTRGRVGTIALDQAAPKFAWVPKAPRSDAPKRAGGESCTKDAECLSGHCFTFDGLWGSCGDCSSDADCNYGCTPPGFLTVPIRPAACGAGGLGEGCENGQGCRSSFECADVATSSSGYTLRACSECSVDADCGAGEICGQVFDLSAQAAYRECATPSARGLGSLCEEDSDCASQKCSSYTFAEGTVVGVCGGCLSSSDCAAAEECVAPTFEPDTGFSPALCE